MGAVVPRGHRDDLPPHAHAMGGGTLLVRGARDSASKESCVEQGADWLLLTPGGGAVEYELNGAGGGRRAIALSIALLAVESDSVQMGGRVLVDGVEVAKIEPFFADSADEVVEVCLDVDLPSEAALLRVECALSEGGPEAHLRLTSVEVRPWRALQTEEVTS